ncbi:Ev1674 [Albugo candida]|uniref:Ev1674 protein n=1 Tax=Albugo candida TaxID=65357 RepID=A0A024GKG8_9STRA|nr:Ev1674 [Albugo candida]|eukprot:CCI47263.1 Ev1674 [Albugo candida]
MSLERDLIKHELELDWKAVVSTERKIGLEKQQIVAEWIRIEKMQEDYSKKRNLLNERISEKLHFQAPEEIMKFNVGGQTYESTVKVWTRDRFSILAQLCTKKHRISPSDDQTRPIYFDRDAWIFGTVSCAEAHAIAILAKMKEEKSLEMKGDQSNYTFL